MCNECAKNLQSLVQKPKLEHNLCAAYRPLDKTTVLKPGLYKVRTQSSTPYFSAVKTARYPQLNSLFSTLYTGPTTNTTKYINK
jgi:hypothetical protein